jgi:hypothetical protein
MVHVKERASFQLRVIEVATGKSLSEVFYGAGELQNVFDSAKDGIHSLRVWKAKARRGE